MSLPVSELNDRIAKARQLVEGKLISTIARLSEGNKTKKAVGGNCR